MKKRVAAGVRGYSLLELMTVVSISATLAAFAIPAFDAVVKDNRRTGAVNEVLRALLHARLEAAKRGREVIICGVADANGNRVLDPSEKVCTGRDWSAGWMTGVWSDADADGRVDAGEVEVLDANLSARPDAVTVRANGLAATPPVAPSGTAVLKPFSRNCSNGTITVCDARGAGQARAVIMAPNGRARVSTRKADGSPLSCP